MEIKSLKELEQLMVLCRKQGIQSVEVNGLKFTIDLSFQAPTKNKSTKSTTKETQINPFDPAAAIDDIKMPDELTPEQLLYYSSTPNGAEQ